MLNGALGKTCPYCQFPIKKESEVKWCPACKIPHHIDCWKENKGCTTFACSGVINTDKFDDLEIDLFGVTDNQEQWYLVRGGIKYGPFPWEQLNCRFDIRPDDMLWSKNYKNWTRADQVISTLSPGDNYGVDVPFNNSIYPRLGMQHAGFWMRFAAFIIDFIILIGCLIIFELIAPGSSDNSLFIIFVQWMYYSLFEMSSLQATPGKLAIGLQVTDLYGQQINFGKATGRYFGRILSGLLLGIGYFMAGFTKEKQTLHDILAGCYVVKK